MSKGRPAVNAINPRGVPRGVANPDRYRLLERLDNQGLNLLDREALEDRLGYKIPEENGVRPSGQHVAHLLLLEAEVDGFMGEAPEDAIERVKAKLAAGDISEGEHDDVLRWIWRQEESDRRAWALVLLTTKQQRTPEEECLLERLEAGEEVELPDRLSEEAAKLLKRQRRRRRGELKGSSPPFARQVGKLAAQTPRQREVTIADWRRRSRQRRPLATLDRDAFGRRQISAMTASRRAGALDR
jgi:hypothetical protein